MCPALNLFNRRRQQFWTLLLLVLNVLFALIYVCFFCPKGRLTIVIDWAEIRNAIIVSALNLIINTCFLLYISHVSNRVYDEIVRINEMVESNTREKEEFFAAMSHEIRNPLQSLMGSIDLMSELYKTNASAQLTKDLPPLLEISKGCCEVVINLVSNILDMSKIASGRMQLSLVPTDLRELANRILRASKSKAEGKAVTLELKCDPAFPPAIDVDPQRVEQVLINLVSNAIKFTSSKGRVVVKLSWFAGDGRNQETVQLALARSSWKQTMEFEEERQLGPSSGQHVAAEVRARHEYARTRDASPRNFLMGQSEPSLGQPSEVSQPQEGIAKVEVMDTGIGISKDGVARLFKAYQQADDSISRYE